MPKIHINNIDLYYATYGKGIPLMLVAGLASDSQSWQPVIRELSRNYLVITPDNRGVGRTTPQDIDISIQQIADDCVALIRHLGYSSINLLGHSMGGFVALDLAIRYPDYLNRLVLVGTSASNSMRNNALFSDWARYLETGMDKETWFRNLFYWIFSQRFFDNQTAVNDAIQYAVDYPYPQSEIAFRNQIKAISDYDCSYVLSSIATKTLVLVGRDDLLFPAETCHRLARSIPEADFTVIEHAAHSIHIEQPMEFTDRVLEFLRYY